MLITNWMGTFHLPVALGVASSFEEERWLDARIQTQVSAATPEYHEKMSTIFKNLHIRAPRLVAAVRRLRVEPRADVGADDIKTLRLAQELFDLKNSKAETEMLHSVSITSTSNAVDRTYVPHSFSFNYIGKANAAIAYWTMRIIVHRLLLEIRLRLPAASQGICSDQELMMENKRYANNILMTLSYMSATGASSIWALQLGMIAVWAVTCDVSGVWRTGLPVEQLRSWMVQRYRELLHGTRQFTALEMDEAADLLAGGPLQGIKILKHRRYFSFADLLIQVSLWTSADDLFRERTHR
jgi:hypothetical protein